jgi:hypothetical protein
MVEAKRTFLFGTLAMNQTLFFEALGNELLEAGHDVAYLCFHERSHDYLRKRGRRSFNAFREAEGTDDSVDLSQYGWPSLNLVLSHEKAAFEVNDTSALIRKLRRYLASSEAVLKCLSAESPLLLLVQELGGFLSNAASFYAARRRGIDNLFIEPSFFRGRVFMFRNTFAARRVPGPSSLHVSEEVAAYLDDALSKQRVVIPEKDRRHYRGPIRKLIDPYNLRRLVEKTTDKYLLRKHEEFAHIAGHVSRHMRMWLNFRALSRRYEDLPPHGQRFIYYPLHVPADVSLTIRSPQYVDQLSLVDYVARAVPEACAVAIKEHPALIGALDRRRMSDLLTKRDNVRLLKPWINNYEIMRRADLVLTVNSKSGAEALLLGRPVVAIGDAFYSACNLVRRVDSLSDLPAALTELLNTPVSTRNSDTRRYFQDVWDASRPGELYDCNENNVRTFAASLLSESGEGSTPFASAYLRQRGTYASPLGPEPSEPITRGRSS